MTGTKTLAAFVLATSACASSTPEINRAYLSGAENEKGVVVFSITRTGQAQAPGSKLRFRCGRRTEGELADHYIRSFYIDGGSLPLPIPPDMRIGPERPVGRVHMLELPARSCQFHSWSGAASNALATSQFSIRFDVPPNRTTYIGNFNVDWSGRLYQLTFADAYERDLAALRKLGAPVPADVGRQVATAQWPAEKR